MGAEAFVILVGGSIIIGFACQSIGHARENYEWAVGLVGALYGGLFANAISGNTLGFGVSIDGLNVIPTLLGAMLLGGLIVSGSRAFDTRRAASRAHTVAAQPAYAARVRFTYVPELLREPVIYQMGRQFGVTIAIGRAEISGDQGWVDAVIEGTPAAVDAALALARRSGVQVAQQGAWLSPALAAA